jgi:hypothetical protein
MTGRIHIVDLPVDRKISQDDMKEVMGGDKIANESRL